jgi:hypothetical protein
VLADDDVPEVWRGLGLPGLLDVHVHFMPDPVLRKVWAYFDSAGYGVDWKISYRGDDADRLDRLRDLGVRRFPSLVYPHKPDMAAWLNDWADEFAERTPEAWKTFTFYPEPSAADYVRTALERGAEIGKVHLQVGAYDPRDPLLDEVWGMCADAGVPLITHCAGSPVPGPFTGPGPIGEVIARHPVLKIVVAHMGMPEHAEFLDLALAHDEVRLDTTMAFTDFGTVSNPVDRADLPRLRDLQSKILFGSDFPNIPYDYGHAVEAVLRLDLGDDWCRDVLWHNASRLLGV